MSNGISGIVLSLLLLLLLDCKRIADRAKEELEQAKYLLGLLKDNFPASTGNEEPGDVITIVTPEFKTYPLNPSAVYRRPYGKGEAIDDLVGLRSGTD